MAGRTGTHDISSLLAATFISAAKFGLDTIALVLAFDLETHNLIVNQMVADFLEMTTDRQRITGASTAGNMIEVDEYGRAATQKEQLGSTVAFPLKKFQYPVGWTSTWLMTHTPKDMAILTQNAEKAHLLKIQAEIKRAIFGSANYSFRDHLVDNISFTIRRFLNADGVAIGDGPNGEVFNGSTHTHYLAISGITAAFVLSLINTVVEHGYGGQVKLAIAQADETAFRALAGFQPYLDPRIQLGTGQVATTRLDITRLNNRAIGIFGAAEVWVKPWVPTSYLFAWDNTSAGKPLAFRQRDQESMQGLRIAAELDVAPLHAQYMEAEFGVAAWTRANGAVGYTGGGSYVDPTITG